MLVNLRHKNHLTLEELDLELEKERRVKSGKTNQGNRKRKNHYELQIEIVKHIINNGICSPFDVEKGLEISKVLANKTFKKMTDHEYISKVNENSEGGVRRKYYSLTNKGIKWILSKDKLNDSEFWKLIFLIYDKNSKIKPDFTIDDYFSDYEKNVLNISRDYFNRYSTQGTLFILKDVIKKTKIQSKQITLFLSYLTEGHRPELIQKHSKKTKLITSSQYIINRKSFSNKIVMMMQFQKLIYLYGTKNEEKDGYHISLLGTLYLLNSLSKLENWNKIDELILNNVDIMPMIFNHWNLLKKKSNLTTQELVGILLYPFLEENKDIFSSPRISIEQRIIGIQFDLEQLTKKELSNEYKIGLKCAQEWAKSNNSFDYIFYKDGHPRADFIPVFGEFSKYLQNNNKILLETINSQCDTVEKYHISSDKINPSIRKIIFNYFEPLRKLGELHVLMDDALTPTMGIIVHDQDIDEKFLPLQNIIAFYFYLLLSYVVNSENWLSYLSVQLKQIGLNKWWKEWMLTLINFDKSQSKKIEELSEIFQT